MKKNRIIKKIADGKLKLKKCVMKKLGVDVPKKFEYIPTQEEKERMKKIIANVEENEEIKRRLKDIHDNINELHAQKDISKTIRVRKTLGYTAFVICAILPLIIASLLVSSFVVIIMFGIRGLMTGLSIKRYITKPSKIKALKIDKKVEALENERIELIHQENKESLDDLWLMKEKNKSIIKHTLKEGIDTSHEEKNNNDVEEFGVTM